VKWKDISSYTRTVSGTTVQAPNTLEARVGKYIRMVIVYDRLDFPNKWICFATPIFTERVLTAQTREEAEREAMKMVRDWLTEAVLGLNEGGGA
jgi:hypothetical protein